MGDEDLTGFPPPSAETRCSKCGIEPDEGTRHFETLMVDDKGEQYCRPICPACQFIEEVSQPCRLCLLPVHTHHNGSIYKISKTEAAYLHHKCYERFQQGEELP